MGKGKNVLVYDVAAEHGGAASVLQYYYEKHKADVDNSYTYLLSTFHLEPVGNVSVINAPEVKKSWFHRILFDWHGAKKVVDLSLFDEVLSLQNTCLPAFAGRQVVYVHNALPFANVRFGLREDALMWVYQNIIGRVIKRSVRKADEVIVQTEWMRRAVSDGNEAIAEKTRVEFPNISIPEGVRFSPGDQVYFFYPANSAKFKNHQVLFKAMALAKRQLKTKITLVLTLNGNENGNIAQLKSFAESRSIDVRWLGPMPRDQVFSWYGKSALVFPSYVETVGLPIYEAASVGSPLVLADKQYAREMSRDCEDVIYFKSDDAEELASALVDLAKTWKCR